LPVGSIHTGGLSYLIKEMILFLVGIKHSGKTSIGKKVASLLNFDFVDSDDLIISSIDGTLTIREFYKTKGKEAFVKQEYTSLKDFLDNNDKNVVVATGGGICDNQKALSLMKDRGKILYLSLDKSSLFKRIIRKGVPPFLDDKDPKHSFDELYLDRDRRYRQISDFVVPLADYRSVDENSIKVANYLIKLTKEGQLWEQIALEQHSL
jgi:shikimate kinase